MAQYKVPQNVDIEDKVIAGLTLRQFAFLMFSGGIVLVLRYVLVGPLSVAFIPAAVAVAAFGLSLAFLKINDRPFEIFLLSAGKTFLRPARRIWQKEVIETTKAQPVAKPAEEPIKKQNYQEVKNKLEKIAMIVDTGGNIPEAQNRISNITPGQAVEPEGLHDVLDKTEKTSEGLEKLFSEAVKKVGKKKKEPTISSLASMEVNKDQYSYEKLPIKSEEEVNEMVEKANEKIDKKEWKES
jgi:hypothetical protein